jgi:UPF0755 protein
MKKLLLFLSIVILIGVAFSAWFIPSAFIGSAASHPVTISISRNSDTNQVAEVLKSKGVIVSSWGYQIYSFIDKAAKTPKSGEYSIAPGASYRDISRQLALGPERDEIEIRFIEGKTIFEEIETLKKHGVSAVSISDLIGNRTLNKGFSEELKNQFDFLKDIPPGSTLEGYLFPDTYRVWKDQLPLGLVLKQLQNFKKQTENFSDQAKLQGRTLHETVILASLLEKEGRTPEERRMIAGIIMNRLKNNMRLQIDATVNFATGKSNARSTFEDLEFDSPYNTYKYKGLPPGPICNPGKDSLEAALNPTPNDYFYYLHDASGKIYYARNIEEHKQNRFKAFNE